MTVAMSSSERSGEMRCGDDACKSLIASSSSHRIPRWQIGSAVVSMQCQFLKAGGMWSGLGFGPSAAIA